jgi:hypothetical protein
MRSTRLLTAVLLLLIASAVSLSALERLQPEQKVPELLAQLTDSLVIANPVILDIRCGEWTPILERELRKALLERQVDIREVSFGLLKDSQELLPLAMETDYGLDGTALLQMFKLNRADYLELTLEQSVETGEKRNLFSYSRYSRPVYRFVLKQISLPEQKLTALREYRIYGEAELENPGSLLAMKWYEPIVAGAVLGSLIYMLWTLK